VAALSHPRILAIYGFGEQGGTVYAVTELLEGRTLRQALLEGPLPVRQALAICREVAEGLAAAHEQGIIHRDLKPENIFLSRDNQPKLLDFGLASRVALSALNATEVPTRTSLTAAGQVIGTTDYMSPEQVRGLTVDARSDLFSLGSVLYEMLSGSRPFRRGTPAETMTAILREDAPPLSSVMESVPVAVEHVVQLCLEKRPEARFSSARDLKSALEDASRSVDSHRTMAETEPTTRSIARPCRSLPLCRCLSLS
jgi:serine/threonine protein kinase